MHPAAPIDDAFLERARLHWTKEREAKVTGGKSWPVMPGAAAGLLRVLGLLNSDASMPADAVRKVSQINHMVTLLLPQIEDLAQRHATVRVLDACCGTSYLTLLVGWLFRERLANKPCQILGIDSNPKVIQTSERRAAALGLADSVRFRVGQVGAGTEDGPRPHLLLSLHACDTATDHAIAMGLAAKADVMALVPCCHAELAKTWKDLGADPRQGHPFAPIFRTPNLRRETAAQITDALRLLLIRSKGYEVTATEFVPSEHTPKNRLLLCIRRGSYLQEAGEQYTALKDATGGAGITLETLLQAAAVTPAPAGAEEPVVGG